MPKLENIVKGLLTLREAEELGYGKEATLRRAIFDKRLKAIKKGRDWITTKEFLNKAGYSNEANTKKT